MKRTVYQYLMEDGRTVLSRSNLDYAMDAGMKYLLLDRLSKNDFSTISILADNALAEPVRTAMDCGEWEEPDYLMRANTFSNISQPRNFCISVGGKIYVNNGKRVELDKFLSEANEEEKNAMILRLAQQASLAHLEMVANKKMIHGA